MKSAYTVMATVALCCLSFGMVGPTEGCNVFAPINIVFSGADGGSAIRSGDDLGDPSSPDSGDVGLEMKAVLTGPGDEHGKAEYEERGSRRKLEVELEDAVPGSVHTILVDGIDIGELTIGSFGEGELEFDTKIEPGHVPWPANLPDQLTEGTIITVGETSGSLVLVASDNDDDDGEPSTDDDDSDDGDDVEFKLEAELVGPSVEHGDAKYRERGTRMRLNVELEDATPGSVQGVFVDGVMIGELTIGSSGEGEVEFDTKIEPGHVPWPTELPDGLVVGAVIEVGPATGSLGG